MVISLQKTTAVASSPVPGHAAGKGAAELDCTSSTTSPSKRAPSTGSTTASCTRRAGDIPPAGRPVSVTYTQVLHFRDGKHGSFNLMFDRLPMLEQLAIVPAPAPAG